MPKKPKDQISAADLYSINAKIVAVVLSEPEEKRHEALKVELEKLDPSCRAAVSPLALLGIDAGKSAPLKVEGWSRTDKLTLGGIIIAVLTLAAALLVIPEARKFVGLDRLETTQPAVPSKPQVPSVTQNPTTPKQSPPSDEPGKHQNAKPGSTKNSGQKT